MENTRQKLTVIKKHKVPWIRSPTGIFLYSTHCTGLIYAHYTMFEVLLKLTVSDVITISNFAWLLQEANSLTPAASEREQNNLSQLHRRLKMPNYALQ